ncbi:chromate resistance protein ChrB domain-containing protein [Noviherbaspirillum soli]|uniref:chromate resistance protein ChrB domain-containing protein n=1 Tax=Noviherbaspirillum soli TaxID=1064518 RepID=UPI00188BA744|nr:chromate resistance protein ChrB domain-containing protein [Noviherbaspirillum soli]
MRLWRSIKALGCAPLRDGAYLLPDRDEHASALAELADLTNREGGNACLVNITPRSKADEESFIAMFDRSTDYAEISAHLVQARRSLASLSASAIAKTVKRMRKELDAVQRIDFFATQASLDVQAVWSDFEEAANAVLSPDEPHAEDHAIALLDSRHYQGRTWATRRHLWADRVASAWLIRRFVDQDAKFLWLDHPAHCPTHALGFDFDGASFTHVGDKVTFEVLLTSFGLEHDRGLAKLGLLIHALDTGGFLTPETIGFEAILSGARSRLKDDDQFLEEMGGVFDSLHIHYGKESTS